MTGNFINIGIHLLVILALIGGVVAMGVAKRNQGKGAVLGMFGGGLLIIHQLVILIYSIWAPSIMSDLGLSAFGIMSIIYGLVVQGLFVIGVGLLVGGVIARRGGPQQQRQPMPGAYGQPQGWQQQPPYGQG
ncbi:hypothetical protein OIE66_08090 [Nonomuraea sp. NBC_01738]|uniref:hypothetical protein n=1 Tax=Nonomuraea sp. NBC_01738 TaxID=2976003 RepID=UPI002E1521B6|nr:hypothetical protein OIE66_08090 [Nonomuraea sp. NBC_01738]